MTATFPSRPAATGAFVRGPQTLAVYGLLGLLTSGYGIVGPLMPFLRSALDLTFTQGSYHTVALAAGTTLVGMIGQWVVVRLGRRGVIGLCLALMAAGQILITRGWSLPVSLAASALFGATVALSVCVVPPVMAERHGSRLGLAIAEANAIAYLGIFLVPGVVSLSQSLAGWEWSFVAPVAAYLVYWLMVRDLDFGRPADMRQMAGSGRLPVRFWLFWSALMLGISAEFGLVVWGASYLETVAALPRALALWASMIFPLGMITGRVAGMLVMRSRPAGFVAAPTLVIAVAGVLVLLSSHDPVVSSAGLFLAGIGIANLYPVGITLAMLSVPGAADRAAARASLASGIAILLSPLVLGAIADRAGLAMAFWVIPVLLGLVALCLIAGALMSRAARPGRDAGS